MNYDDTLKFIETLQPKAFRLELGPMLEACSLLLNPQDSFPTIHISGTNGKGSTAAFLESILRGSGYRVGLYTSPHLVDMRERIQVNRKLISKEALANIAGRVREELLDDRMLSFFEFITLAAFLHFADEHVDIAIIETGLGGRLDATNVIHPLVSVITPISFDHVQHLGKTLKDIAFEKCGVIKRGVPTVVAYQSPEVMDVIKHCCDDIGSPLCLATPDEVVLPLGLAGEHQRQNAACAIEAAQMLPQSSFHISGIDKALLSTKWEGRLETVTTSPRIILDGAHNVAGAESLASYVRTEVIKEKAVLVLGVLADKDVSGIVRPLAPLFREIVCVRASSHRAASPKDLAAAARSAGAKVAVGTDLKTAIGTVMKKLKKDETLVVSGSLTMVGEAKEYFSNYKK